MAEIAGKPQADDEDFLYLFFHDTESSRALGAEHLARLAKRVAPFGPEVAAPSYQSQLHALVMFAAGEDSTLNQLASIRQPALVANGWHDRMIHPDNSYVMALQMPSAELVLYPDAGHGFLFQLAERFGELVVDFLARP